MTVCSKRVRSRVLASTITALGGLTANAARANLLVTEGLGDSISHLSVQLMDEPRSAAGRRKNVWDMDPPEPATSGLHYFLYDYGPDGKLLPQGQRPLTFQGIAPGPDYNVQADVLVRSPSVNGGTPFYYTVQQTFDYDGTDTATNLPALGYEELGVVRVTLTPYAGSGYGQIQGELDSPELAYDGLKENGQFVRGDEHARIFTSTLAGHDDDTISGEATTVVPAGYLPDYPTFTFDPGYLQFPDGTFRGDQVLSAAVSIPEPAVLAVAGVAGLMGLRRRRV